MWARQNKPHKYKHRLRFREYGLEFDLEYHAYAIPQKSQTHSLNNEKKVCKSR